MSQEGCLTRLPYLPDLSAGFSTFPWGRLLRRHGASPSVALDKKGYFDV